MPNMPNVDTWALLIPDYFPPSPNRWARAHWSKVRRNKIDALSRVHLYALAAGGIPRFEGPVKVQLTRIIGHRQRAWDRDNLIGAVKPLIDALRAPKEGRNRQGRHKHGGLGIIADDNPDSLELEVRQEKLSPALRERMVNLGIDIDGPNGLTQGQYTGAGSGTLIVIEGERIE